MKNKIKITIIYDNTTQNKDLIPDWGFACRNLAFVFDNETPVHQEFVAPYELASRPVISGEFIEFIELIGWR